MNNIIITKAKLSDVEIMFEWGNSTPELWFNDVTKWYPKKEMVATLVNSEKALFLVARDNDKPVGMCLVHDLIVWGYCDTLFCG
jgi:hypothetical protein